MSLLDAGGYVLAGGMSSRMGRDKALLQLSGRPLIAHAVSKLRRVCRDVQILSSRPELEKFAPLVSDLHPGCGPLGGIEAAFQHSRHEWNLFMPVDMPFLPSSFLFEWTASIVNQGSSTATRVAMFTVSGTPQPLFCLLHRDVAPFVCGAMRRGEYKVFSVLQAAAKELAAAQGVPFQQTFRNPPWELHSSSSAIVPEPATESWRIATGAQQAAKHLWFANLNTPDEFAEAEQHSNALDT